MLVWFTSAALLTFITTLFLAFLVYLKNRPNPINQHFSLFNYTMAFWSFGYLRMITSENSWEGLLWARILHIGAIFIPILFLNFTSVFIDILQQKKKIIKIGYMICIMLLFILITPLFVVNVKPLFCFKFFIIPGKLYHIFTIFFFFYVIYTEYLLIKAFKNYSGIKKQQIAYIFIAYFFAFLGGGTTFLSLFNIPTPIWGIYLLPLGMIIVTYAISKYQLMDIRIVISRILIFILVYSIFWLTPTLTMIWNRDYLLSVLGKFYWYLFAFLEALLTTVGLVMFRKLRINAENYLCREENLRSDKITDLSNELVAKKTPGELFEVIGSKVMEIYNLKLIGVYMPNETDNNYSLVYSKKDVDITKDLPNQIKESNLILAFLKEHNRPLIYEDLINSELSVTKEFDLLGVRVILPCIYRNKLLAFIVLGRKKDPNTSRFTLRELIPLRFLTTPIAMQLKNILFLSQVQENVREEIIQEWKKEQKLQRELVTNLSKEQSLEDLYKTVLSSSSELLGVNDGQIYHYDKKKQKFSLKAFIGKGLNYFSDDIEPKHPLIELLTDKKAPLTYEEIEQHANELNDSRLKEACRKLKYVGASLIVPINLDEKVIAFIALGQKSSELKFQEKDIERIADFSNQAAIAIELRTRYEEITHDPLTGAYNRFFRDKEEFMATDRGVREWRLGKRGIVYCKAILDLNDFKKINDKYGHSIGDRILELLVYVANSVCRRKLDFICRVGGDEFELILEATSLSKAKELVELILEKFSQEAKKVIPEIIEPVTATAGLSGFDTTDKEYLQDIEDFAIIRIIKKVTVKADQSLYEAKRTGKNKVCYVGKLESNKVVLEDIPTNRIINIFIADDEAVILDSFIGALKYSFKEKYSKEVMEIFLAKSFKEGLGITKEKKLDIAILDVRLGDGQGTDLIPLIRKQNPKAYIIIITGFTKIERKEFLKLGADKVYYKPLPIEEIIDDIINYLPTIG